MTERGLGTGCMNEIVASYRSHEKARRPAGHLSDTAFPAGRLSIDVRRGFGRVAARGAGSGALVGVLFGSFVPFGLIDPLAPAVVLVAMGTVFGALFGALTGPRSHVPSGGRDLSPVDAIRARRYGVVSDEGFAQEARGVPAGLGGNLRGRR